MTEAQQEWWTIWGLVFLILILSITLWMRLPNGASA